MAKKTSFSAAGRTLWQYGREHRGELALALAGSVGVAVTRLAIPWPLRWAIDLAGDQPIPLETGWDPVTSVVVAYTIVGIALGASEYRLRTSAARFSSSTVDGLRGAAAAAASADTGRPRHDSADVMARIIGDSARLRSDLSGILVHATTNSLLFVCVSVLMASQSMLFGSIFLMAGLVAVAVGAFTSGHVASIAVRQRAKEGRFAIALRDAVESDESDAGSQMDLGSSAGRKEVRATRLLARSALWVHSVQALGVSIGLWIGIDQVRSGALEPGVLFLFVAYALTVHRRLVQVGRQIGRTGKVVACTDRLSQLTSGRVPQTSVKARPLEEALKMTRVRLAETGGARRLKSISLKIEAGQKVAILGNYGSGKSSLLRAISGREPDAKGKIRWDGLKVSGNSDQLAARVGFVGETPAFAWAAAHAAFDLPVQGPGPEQKEILRRLGALRVVGSLQAGWEGRLASAALTLNEARSISLAQLVLNNTSPLWALDGILDGFPRRRAKAILLEILDLGSDQTILLSMSRPICLDRFDRIIRLRHGSVDFDGTPSEWKHRARGSVPNADAGAA